MAWSQIVNVKTCEFHQIRVMMLIPNPRKNAGAATTFFASLFLFHFWLHSLRAPLIDCHRLWCCARFGVAGVWQLPSPNSDMHQVAAAVATALASPIPIYKNPGFTFCAFLRVIILFLLLKMLISQTTTDIRQFSLSFMPTRNQLLDFNGLFSVF